MCLSSDSLLRISISSTSTHVMPSRSICGLGAGMTLTPSQSLMSATFCFLLLLGRDDHRLLDRRPPTVAISARLRLIREQVLERFVVVLVLGEQAAQDLDLAAVLGELLLLRDRRVVDVDVERQLALAVDDQPEHVEHVPQVERGSRRAASAPCCSAWTTSCAGDHAAPRVLDARRAGPASAAFSSLSRRKPRQHRAREPAALARSACRSRWPRVRRIARVADRG